MSSEPDAVDRRVAPAIRAAGAVYVANAIGFGVGAAWTMWHLGSHGELPMTPFGFRSMSGPFESLGTSRLTNLGWALVVVCAIQAIGGIWLWRGRRRGAVVGLATTPPAIALGAGFALPFYLISIPIELALLALGRRTLR